MFDMATKVETYVQSSLGIPWATLGAWEGASSLPRMLSQKYRIVRVAIGVTNILLVCDVAFGDTPSLMAKQVRAISEIAACPVVYASSFITPYTRKVFTQMGVSFIVPNSQMYIYPLGIVIKDRLARESISQRLSPAAQALFIYCILNENDFTSFPLCFFASQLQYSNMTISRAERELKAHMNDETSLMFSQDTFFKFSKILISPVKKILYLSIPAEGEYLESGVNALSRLSDISLKDRHIMALTESEWRLRSEWHQFTCKEYEARSEIEIWKYNPRILGENNIVDVYSLYLSLRDANDPRIDNCFSRIFNRNISNE